MLVKFTVLCVVKAPDFHSFKTRAECVWIQKAVCDHGKFDKVPKSIKGLGTNVDGVCDSFRTHIPDGAKVYLIHNENYGYAIILSDSMRIVQVKTDKGDILLPKPDKACWFEIHGKLTSEFIPKSRQDTGMWVSTAYLANAKFSEIFKNIKDLGKPDEYIYSVDSFGNMIPACIDVYHIYNERYGHAIIIDTSREIQRIERVPVPETSVTSTEDEEITILYEFDKKETIYVGAKTTSPPSLFYANDHSMYDKQYEGRWRFSMIVRDQARYYRLEKA
jgi:hypothetical protein